MRRRWAPILSLSGFLFSPEAWAQLGLCVPNPLGPPCCPVPCPIADPSRLQQVTQSVQSLQQVLRFSGQWATEAAEILQKVGGTVSPPQDLLAVLLPGAKLVASAPPGMSGSAVDALQSLKSSLFLKDDQNDVASAVVALRDKRSNAAVTEARDGMSLAIARISSSSSPSSGAAEMSMPGADGLRSDLQISSRGRLKILSDLILTRQLLAGEAAREASYLALRSSTTLQPAPVQSAATARQFSKVGAAKTFSSSVGTDDSGSRAAAATLLAAYAPLQTILDQARLSTAFAANASGVLGRMLPTIGIDQQQLPSLQGLLRQLDGSSWGENADAGAQAVAKIVSQFNAAPGSAGGEVEQAMLAWLQADKQSRYWQDLAAMAAGQIAALYHRRGQISYAVGYDITASVASSAALQNKNRR